MIARSRQRGLRGTQEGLRFNVLDRGADRSCHPCPLPLAWDQEGKTMNPFLLALSMWNQRPLWCKDVSDDMHVVVARFERAWDFLPAHAPVPGDWVRLGAVGELLDRPDLPEVLSRRLRTMRISHGTA